MKWRRFFQFRLSTIFFVVTLAAVLMAWAADHYSFGRREIVGTWHFPHAGLKYAQLGFSSTLRILPDGTFEKIESGRSSSSRYSGIYRCEKDGTVVFHVTSKKTEDEFGEMYNSAMNEMRKRRGEPPEPYLIPAVPLDETYHLRCAVDKQGYLIVASVALDSSESGLGWGSTYARSR